jgi:hypothetical protein
MRIVAICSLLAFCASASAQPANSTTKEVDQATLRQLHGHIPTKPFHEKMAFAKFLALLGSEASREKPLSIRLDREAFGRDADGILNKEVSLPEFPHRMSLHMALRLALSRGGVSDDYEIEYIARAGTILITTRDRSMYSVTYEIGELLTLTVRLHEDFKRMAPATTESWFDAKADPTKPAEWVARQVFATTDPDRAGWHKRIPASTLRIEHGTKMIVHTAPSVHEVIGSHLSMLRRMADLFVVVNCRVYALDRAVYEKHFAKAFIDLKDKSPRVVTVTETQWKLLQGLKPVQKHESGKLVPYQRAEFFAFKNAYQYQALPGDAKPAIGFEGLTWTVNAEVSPDRRCMRLHVQEDVAQLIKLTKGTKLDLKTGKEGEIELPNVRKSSQKGTIEIHDGQPMMATVGYRPANNQVWLLLAEPRIYMEEEEEYLRKAAIKPMLLADEKPEPPEPPEPPLPIPDPAMQLPDDPGIHEIVRRIVEAVLKEKEIQGTREFYGTPGEKKFELDNDSNILWPKAFRPKVEGFDEESLTGKCRGFRTRLMGIRIDEFDLKAFKAGKKVRICIVIHNVGGSINGAVIGGAFVTFSATPIGKGWKVQWLELFDP